MVFMNSKLAVIGPMLSEIVVLKNSVGEITYVNRENWENDQKISTMLKYGKTNNEFQIENEFFECRKDFIDEEGASFSVEVYKNITNEIIDSLTGLKNRRALERDLDDLGRNHNNIVAMIDIDNFKDINDKIGHEYGDYVLKKIANVFLSDLRVSDLAIRFGGDEFLIVLKECSIYNACIRLDDLRKKINSIKFEKLEDRDFITLSFGMSSCKNRGEFDVAKEHADLAMYESKSHGGNIIKMYDKTMEN